MSSLVRADQIIRAAQRSLQANSRARPSPAPRHRLPTARRPSDGAAHPQAGWQCEPNDEVLSAEPGQHGQPVMAEREIDGPVALEITGRRRIEQPSSTASTIPECRAVNVVFGFGPSGLNTRLQSGQRSRPLAGLQHLARFARVEHHCALPRRLPSIADRTSRDTSALRSWCTNL